MFFVKPDNCLAYLIDYNRVIEFFQNTFHFIGFIIGKLD